MKHYNVVAAIIVNNNKILCVQRGESKYDYISRKYEFPGGKIELGETKQETIIREIKEELELEIEIKEEFITINHNYKDFSIRMSSFICTCKNNNLKLKEHLNFLWLKREELIGLDWAAADVPIVNELLKRNSL